MAGKPGLLLRHPAADEAGMAIASHLLDLAAIGLGATSHSPAASTISLSSSTAAFAAGSA
jgi:hypothetical protein